ncbi:glycosyltransferase family 4 protein [Synechococcus sp. HJ21-Hayes]|nr:glycosyltransferase family 4 protein [Synechococcus sp. HJ21-Hayes]
MDFTLKNFLLPLVDGMREEGWQVVAICSDGKEIAGLRAQGYCIKTIPIARSMNPFFALRSLIQLTRFFRRQSFDVLHVHTPVAALIGRMAARLAGIPLVVYTAHGFYFHDHMPQWKRAFFVQLERIAGHFTDLLFCQSKEDAATAIHEGIAPESRVVAIGNGVDPRRFNPQNVATSETVRFALGIPRDAFVVGLIGRQVREKGIGEFLGAMTSLANRHTHLWVLLIGERLASDHDQGVVAAFAAAQDVLGHRLMALGSREDIPQLLVAMDLFCLPSWREGMPRTIIEAMMMAKPVVATNIRGAREEVVPEETGLLVPVRSPGELAAGVERMLLNPGWGTRLGKAGRERALRLYDENHVIAAQIKLINKEVASLRSDHGGMHS